MGKNEVSIIVPVYNVENYVEYTVESLLNQTYKNIEIILVDDGSTDNSGKICDKYALEDNRIKVFHKDNGGLSDARNYGISKATSDWIIFVDSDDYLEKYAIEYLVKTRRKYNVDLVITPNRKINNLNIFHDKKEDIKEILYTPEESLEKVYYGDPGVSVCGKLFSKKVVCSNEFPKGKIFEDLYTIYKYILDSQKVCISDLPVYNYYTREGSITQNKYTEKQLDFFKAIEENEKYLIQNLPNNKNLRTALNCRRIGYSFSIINMMCENKLWKEVYMYRKAYFKYFSEFILNNNVIKSQKIKYLLFILSPKLFHYLYRKYLEQKRRK